MVNSGDIFDKNQNHSASGDNVEGNVNINYNFQGATFGGGFAGRDYKGNVNNNDAQSRDNYTLNEYLNKIEHLLINEGCLDLKKKVNYENQQFNLFSKITNFEIPFGLFNMRGDAFFIFAHFPSINIKTLRQYSSKCLQYAIDQTTSSPVGQILNAKFPCNVCFAVAIVDDLEQETQNIIQTENPFDFETDTLWYKVPVVYCLNEERLYFYDQPSSFWENFKGEIVWKRLRQIIETVLNPKTEQKNYES